MSQPILCWVLITVSQQVEGAPDKRSPATWTEFYRDTAGQYQVTYLGKRDTKQTVPLRERAVFDWSSISDFNGAVFAWTEDGRPSVVATLFSFPRGDSKERLLVAEFASLAETKVTVEGPGGISWSPPPLSELTALPDAPRPATDAKKLRLDCRRLAKDFSAAMNRRGERWDLRLLTTPLLEYQASSPALGGALFAFVGYSTDPEILLLLEARETKDDRAWYFYAVRFSDKSLFLSFKEKKVWQSLRKGHGTDDTSTEDPHYRVLSSQRLSAETVEKLSAKAKSE
jgi:hypothetical protein